MKHGGEGAGTAQTIPLSSVRCMDEVESSFCHVRVNYVQSGNHSMKYLPVFLSLIRKTTSISSLCSVGSSTHHYTIRVIGYHRTYGTCPDLAVDLEGSKPAQ